MCCLLGLLLVFSACGSDDEGGQASTGNGGSIVPPGKPVIDEPPPDVQRLIDELTQAPEQEDTFEQPSQSALFTSGITNPQLDLQATEAYLDATIKHADTIWTNWFTTNGLSEPGVGYEIIQPGETYTTLCDGGQIVDSSYNNAFYCPADPNTTGVGGGTKDDGVDEGYVVLPAETFAQMWTGDIFDRRVDSVQRVGDFAAGVIATHEFGHHIAHELSQQLGAQLPGNPNIELIADCFAGVWAYSVFLDNYLEEGDIEEAVNALGAIGDVEGSHGTPDERRNAFLIGYTGTVETPGGGVPQRCMEQFWR
jgi:uncharacterized protein